MGWNLLKQEDQNYLFQCCFESNRIIVKFTNLIQFWSASFQVKEVILYFQEQNPLVEAPEESLVKYIKNILDISKSTVTVAMLEEGVKVSLQFTSNLQGIPFSLDLHLPSMKSTSLYNDIIVPLLLTIQNLQFQKKFLIDQLKKKDTEIKEYKLEGCQLTRKNVETVVFNESNLSDLPLSVENLESTKILSVLSECKMFDELCKLMEARRQVEPSVEAASNSSSKFNCSVTESSTKESDSEDVKRRKLNS